MNQGEDDDAVTAADLKEAQERWADPAHAPVARELFAAPVYGPGFRGDLPVGPPADAPPEDPPAPPPPPA